MEDPAQYVGQSLQFIVREIKENGRNVVLSRRMLLQAERDKRATSLLAGLPLRTAAMPRCRAPRLHFSQTDRGSASALTVAVVPQS